MIVSEWSTQVNDLLRPMGITRNLSAYSILCQCLELYSYRRPQKM